MTQGHIRGGIAARIVGVVSALAMLATGMVVSSTANAADAETTVKSSEAAAPAAASDGNVKLDWNLDGHTSDYLWNYNNSKMTLDKIKQVPSEIQGRKTGDAWSPDLNPEDTWRNEHPGSDVPEFYQVYDPNSAYFNDSYRGSFFAWNSKKDGTGDTYVFRSGGASGTDDEFRVVDAPKTTSGAVKWPEGGTLYAQWGRSSGSGVFHVDEVKRDANAIKKLKFFTYGWGGKTYQANFWIRACTTFYEDDIRNDDQCLQRPDQATSEWSEYLRGDWQTDDKGEATIDLSKFTKDSDFDDFVNAVVKDQNIKYLRLGNFGAVKLVDGDPQPLNQQNGPRFTSWNSNTSTTVGDTWLTMDRIKDRFAAVDADGTDLKDQVKIEGTLDTSKPGVYWLKASVKGKNGTAASEYVVTVRPQVVANDKLIEVKPNKNLVSVDTTTENDSFTPDLSAYKGQIVTVYLVRQNNDGSWDNSGSSLDYYTQETVKVPADGNVQNDISFNPGSGKFRVIVIPWQKPDDFKWDELTRTQNGGGTDPGQQPNKYCTPEFTVDGKTIAKPDDAQDTTKAEGKTVPVSDKAYDPLDGVSITCGGVAVADTNRTVIGSVNTTKPGQYELSYFAYDSNNRIERRSFVVTVSGTAITVPVDSVTISGDGVENGKLTVDAGNTATLTATVTPDNATDKNVTWTSSDENVVKVENGKVIAIAAGKAEITATAGDKSAKVEITVNKVDVSATGVIISGAGLGVNDKTKNSTLSLAQGDSADLDATIQPEGATGTVTWASSDDTVATVKDGKVTAKGQGTTTITATVNGTKTTVEVTVEPKPAENSVKKDDLKEAIDKADAMKNDAAKYTTDSWDEMQKQLGYAQTVQKDGFATQTRVDAATGSLSAAIKGLKLAADKTDLNNAIADAEKLNEQDYTSDSWKAFAGALESAKKVADDKNATAEQVQQATKALQDAQKDLQKKPTTPSTDKSDLNKAIAAAKQVDQSAYTPESVQPFREALAEAESVAANQSATADEIKKATAALKQAQQNLQQKPSNPTPSQPSTPSYSNRIYVDTKPDKKEYKIGEKFDPAGMVVKHQQSNGSVQTLEQDDYTAKLDTSKPGTAEVTITLNDDPTLTTSFDVTVVVSDLPVHRLYNPRSGEHFYTAGTTEYNVLLKSKQWNDEGIAFTMADWSSKPVYRLYNPGGKHLFTTSEKERDVLIKGKWRYEGIAFYVPEGSKTEVRRLYNPGNGDHLLTTSANERGVLVMHKWRDEGIAFTAK